MLRWYADDSAMKTDTTIQQPNVLIYGGIVIEHNNIMMLSDNIKEIKREYGHQDLPVKWNFRDLRRTYESLQSSEQFEVMLANSSRWRQRMIEACQAIDYKIVFAALGNYQTGELTQELRTQLTEYAFSNCLMRIGLLCQDYITPPHTVICDWPESNNPKPINRQYYYAFHRGTDADRNRFYCGPLSGLGFEESVFFTKSTHSIGLQFADICLGAIRDYINCRLDGREFSHGLTAWDFLRNKMNGFPNDIIGRGIILQTGNDTFRRQIEDVI